MQTQGEEAQAHSVPSGQHPMVPLAFETHLHPTKQNKTKKQIKQTNKKKTEIPHTLAREQHAHCEPLSREWKGDRKDTNKQKEMGRKGGHWAGEVLVW